MPNHLADAASPYLLQHKDNPVDWWEWTPEAFAEARRSKRPILLSIGYAACHWCHVMAHESFEDQATAAVMNELFVNIKVDREERPEVDQIYMAALQQLGVQGGWPMTMFLDPEGAPFWGGTYFPKEARYGQPAFTDVLKTMAGAYASGDPRITQNRAALLERLRQKARPASQVVIGTNELDDVAGRILGIMDTEHGGLQGSPKFPNTPFLELLWRGWERTGRERLRDAALHALDGMSEGGIYDHIGGGYSRYSVDERWLVPHFEKMLYDNAQILDLLGLAYSETHAELFRARAEQTVGWLQREMMLEGGAFAASLDADSEGHEGRYYVWTLKQVLEALGAEDAEFFARHYDIVPFGNWEGVSIPNRLKEAARSGDDEARLALLRDKLLAVREKRVPPGRDDKVLADWNGLMIAALVGAAPRFGRLEWVTLAADAFRFISESMMRDGRLGHSWREGRLVFPGLASDYAAMIGAALSLHQATGEGVYLDQALAWQAKLEADHATADGGYYLTADDAEGLILRPDATADDAVTNPQALIARNLVRIAVLTGDERYRQRADRLFDGLLPRAAPNLYSHAGLLNALDTRLRAPEIVVLGSGEAADALAEAAYRLPRLDITLLRVKEPATLPADHPARAKADSLGTAGASVGAAAFVCAGGVCSLPVTESNRLAEAVRGG
ncbi:thioredoxin domain-containing protein [Ancylobacter dichloromethanicus]|uniref:Thioredoxin domain-containing protein n=1 Tax=Ancylobacter dichloromethanicus TaxID=518825 RepID=A0A9W6N0L6_9HYPH|nr:thioredoxin domain-containing protein [Ancylobacter dichloromethanicus]MBS7554924.1 thioredoxin domain-containing protein [Ancylobacter dichloromethanicus]GLK73318.1 thioredoxin domain-containing protein [Ancylobacter dichloromethanicus]